MKEQKPKGYWTLERCKAEALKYASRIEWQKKAVGSYEAAWINGWLDACCMHMQMKRRTFTEAELIQAARGYETRMKFKAGSPHEYQAAYRAGCLDQYCAHMKVLVKRWTLQELKAAAQPFTTRGAFEKGNPTAYNTALRKKVLDECCGHMHRINEPRGYWTKERCIVKAQDFTCRVDWQKGHPPSYQAASKKKWVEECAAHMDRGNIRWSEATAKAEAQKYSTRSDFIRGCGSAYNFIKAVGQLDEACAHMKTVVERSDSVYVWQAVGETYNGKNVYKIGVAREVARLDRIQRCAHKNGMQFKLLTFRWVGSWQAKSLEKYLLAFGENPKLSAREGKTEFRALTAEELQTIIKIIESHPIL